MNGGAGDVAQTGHERRSVRATAQFVVATVSLVLLVIGLIGYAKSRHTPSGQWWLLGVVALVAVAALYDDVRLRMQARSDDRHMEHALALHDVKVSVSRAPPTFGNAVG